jgi:hypothetical protein
LFADRIESTAVGQSVPGAHERYPHNLTSRDLSLGTQCEGREGSFSPCKFALECLSEPFGGGPVEAIDAAFEELEAKLRGGASLRSRALPPSGRLRRRHP